MTTRTLKSEVTGKVLQRVAAPGAEVEEGQDLMILESMKMEIPVQAPCKGTLLDVLVQEGAQVIAGQPLMTLRADGG